MRHVLLIAMLAGCHGGAKTEGECKTEATAVGDLLVAAAKEPPSPLTITDDVHLVTRTDLPTNRDLRQAPVVTVTPTTLKLDDKDVADTDGLAIGLRGRFEKVQADLDSGRMRPAWIGDPRRVYLAIDPTTPWERVANVVASAGAAGLTAPAFVFEQPTSLKPPPRAEIDDKLDALMKDDPANRASEVAQLMSKVIDHCPALKKQFGAVASEEGDKGMTLSLAVAPALIECKCQVDIPNLRAVMFRILYVKRPLRFVTFEADAAKEKIEMPKPTTWAEASKRFTPTLKNAELVAR
ncbi:MAG TPA: hypothetical protein VFV99_34000 [Kofleriaceae bacterium]|nr:hypothetical protein [Kofleriaceae bacterium]